MAKPMAVTLPFVLLLLDYWPLKRFAIYDLRFTIYKNLLLEKIPFLLLAGIGCALTLHAQQIAIVSTAGLTLPQRLVHTLVAYNHYFWAMFSPFNLSVYYPYVIKLESATVIFSSLLVLMLTVLAVIQWRKRPYLIVGWLWFLGTLVPVIGLVQVGDQAWADRYTYLPLIGLFVALVWFVSESITSRMWLGVFSAGIAVVLIVTTSLQLRHWQNTRTLFEHADQVTPHNYMAITLLGSLLAKEHKLDEAMSHYRRALSYQPAYPEAHFFMGYALDEQGKFDEAIAEYQQALWFRPTQEQTHIFMAIALGKQKKYSEATEHYSAALKLNPDSAVAHNNLARILHTQGQFSAAIEHYQLALEIDPKLELAHNNLGVLLLQQGDLVGGTKQLREALKLKPNNMETEFNLAVALSQQEQWGEAADHFSNTASLHPNDPKSRYQFGLALAHLDRAQEAMSQFASALLIQPDYADALDGLAWLLSTDSHADLRNGSEAVKMAERACELTSNQEPTKLLTLAAAYAEVGQFDKATNTLQTAKAMATKASLLNLIKQSALMQEHFQKSEPWREGPAQ
jgi:tetratricopeptide (TPR) repeat protein